MKKFAVINNEGAFQASGGAIRSHKFIIVLQSKINENDPYDYHGQDMHNTNCYYHGYKSSVVFETDSLQELISKYFVEIL